MNESEFRALKELGNKYKTARWAVEEIERLHRICLDVMRERDMANGRLRAVVQDASVLSYTPQEVIMTAALHVRCERCRGKGIAPIDPIDSGDPYDGEMCDCINGWRPMDE